MRLSVDRRRVLTGAIAASIVSLPRLSLSASAAPAAPVVLAAAPGKLRLSGPADTPVWAYNGVVPGPLLRVRLGQTLHVRLENRLPQPTTLCWHGVRVPNAMDGVAGLTQQAVPPGGTYDYPFAPPDSGMFWYHPHIWPQSAEQIGRGLYGLLIVDEPHPPAVDEDLLVVLDDWTLDRAGRIPDDAFARTGACPAGTVGSLLTVNSGMVPDRRVFAPGSRIRLRLLNACALRIVVAGLRGSMPTVVAVDGQPSGAFEPAQGLVPVGPGARFEFIFDVPTSPTPDLSLVLREPDGTDRVLVRFAVAGQPRPLQTAAKKLPDNPLLPVRIPLERAARFDLEVGGAPTSGAAPGRGDAPPWCWTLGGKASDGTSGRPLFAIPAGTAVTLTLTNRTASAQQIHLHGHVFRVLHDLDDGWDPFWRDSVLIGPNRTKHIAFIADNPGRWAIESSMPERQVTGMAGFFLVAPAKKRTR